MKTIHALLLAASVPAVAAAQTYRVVDLGAVNGQSQAFAIADSGRAAGSSTDATSHFVAVAFDDQPLVIPGLPGFAEHVALAFAPSGDLVGTAYSFGSLTSAAFRASGGVTVSLGSFQARATNAAGDVAGTTLVESAGLMLPTACLLSGGVLSTLPSLGGITSQAMGIDAGGRVVGNCTTTAEASSRPTLWFGGLAIDLGTLGGVNGQAYAITGNRIIGWSQNAAGLRRATLWTIDASGVVLSRTDLGGLTPGSPSIATCFGPGADVVGSSAFHAVLFRGGVIDLNTRVLLAPDWTLEQAWSINASGQIAGSGSMLGYPRAFRLDPCLADIASDQVIDLNDFFAFLNCFDQSLPCADIDGSPGVDLGDFFTFFNAFDAGC